MKLKTFSPVLFSIILCLFISSSYTAGKEENQSNRTPFISGNLYSYEGCGTVPVADADYYMFNRTTNKMICGGKTGPDGGFICEVSFNVPNLVYLHFTKNGKVGCYLLDQRQPNVSGLRICMTNSGSCPNEW